jgi:PEP-CTERM motif-containing protein
MMRAVFALALLLACLPALGGTIIYEFSDQTNGTSTGTIAPGVDWCYTADDWSIGVEAEALWPEAAIPATDFHIIFEVGDYGLLGDSYFQHYENNVWVSWMGTIDNNEADFYAPQGYELNPGQKFRVQLKRAESGKKMVDFNGAWTGVPEASTYLMLGVGLLGVITLRIRKSC